MTTTRTKELLMRILLAGASGALGRSLTPALLAVGHTVVGTTRTERNQDTIGAMGATPALMDGLDRASVEAAVEQARPEVVIHQLTSLKGGIDPKHFDRSFELTNRLRTEGTDHLLEASRRHGVRRFIAQSYTGWPNPRTGPDQVLDESAGLDPDVGKEARKSLDAIRHLEDAVLDATDLEAKALRYGGFYGPGTGMGRGEDGEMAAMIRGRKFPIVGGGTGVWSFVHVADAASATVAAVERGAPGLYNIVDDEPAPVSEWLPVLAEALGAKPPLRLPVWLARPLLGQHGINLMTSARGSSNARAKRELGWTLRHPSWRQGFVEG